MQAYFLPLPFFPLIQTRAQSRLKEGLSPLKREYINPLRHTEKDCLKWLGQITHFKLVIDF